MRLTMCKQQLAYNMYCYYTLTNWDAPPQKNAITSHHRPNFPEMKL